jgi:hypothetical protein
MRVLGVDPGSRITGYGLVEEKNRQISFVKAGLIKPPEKCRFHRKFTRFFKGLRKFWTAGPPMPWPWKTCFTLKCQEFPQTGACPRGRSGCRRAAGYCGL